MLTKLGKCSLPLLPIAVLAGLTGCTPKSETAAIPASQMGARSTETPPPGTNLPVEKGTDPAPVVGEAKPPTEAPNPATSTGTPPVATETVPTKQPSATPAPTSGPVTLRYAFVKGAQLKYKTSMDLTMDMPSMSKKEGDKPMNTTSTTIVKVLDSNAGKAKVEMSYADMAINGGSRMMNSKQMEKSAKEIAEMKTTMTYDQFGTASDVKADKRGSMGMMMGVGMTESGFLGLKYPDKPVAIGESWKHSTDFKKMMDGMGAMGGAGMTWKDSEIVMTYTLKSIDPSTGKAVIAINMAGNPSFSMKMPGGTVPKGNETPSEFSMSFKYSSNGLATIDLKTGFPIEIKSEVSIDSKSAAFGGAMSQKMKSVIKRM